ncbi:MAG TPA: F0F1 ATP synthase subunit B [Candidatus Cottocaccamicrobium excrementipullorum]|nr:F0F1 ATP synthase subunit B [Candidatus Cottocaccamicrobium excrementipullorum]
MLRIDFWNIAFIIINLLVLYLFMKHFLVGPVMKIVEQRQSMVEKDLDQAASARKEAEEAKAQCQAAAAGADEKAQEIIKDARAKAQAEYDRILAQAGKDADKKLENAEKTIELEREKALGDLKLSVAELAMTAAARLMTEQNNAGEDKKRYQAFLAESGEAHD